MFYVTVGLGFQILKAGPDLVEGAVCFGRAKTLTHSLHQLRVCRISTLVQQQS